MAKIFFPGCKIKSRYPEFSEKLKEYIKSKYNFTITDCCKENYQKLNDNDTAVLICNNCKKELSSLSPEINTEYVYDLINGDESFSFPDYHSNSFMLLLCHHGYGNHDIFTTAKELLTKMNVDFTTCEYVPEDGLDINEHMDIAKKAALATDKPVVTICPICNLAILNEGHEAKMLGELLLGT